MAKKILIIDDEELIVQTLARVLEKNRYDVLIAKTGNDAIVMAEEEDFDLIISDVRMPGMNGVETCRSVLEVIKAKKRKDVPLIFITGYADEAIETKAKALSPRAYIYKPFDYAEFLTNVHAALKG
ncbi:MAG TPA: response regulator [Candidatus Omnitrophota bacterium]|nr:response regulator [Candidatus Omnitrophota bacterium]